MMCERLPALQCLALHYGQWIRLPFCLPSLIVQWPARIGDFRVVFRLCFKVSPGAKPFICNLVLFTCKGIRFTNCRMKGFTLGLALKQRQKTSRKSPILHFYLLCMIAKLVNVPKDSSQHLSPKSPADNHSSAMSKHTSSFQWSSIVQTHMLFNDWEVLIENIFAQGVESTYRGRRLRSRHALQDRG